MNPSKTPITTLLCGLAAIACSCGGDADPARTDAAPVPLVDGAVTVADGQPACVYPPGPYGVEVNDILDPSLTWEGYAEDASTPGTSMVEELFDCDGSKGINAILFSTAQFGSAPDASQAQDIASKLTEWDALGIRTWFLLVDDMSGGAPTLAGVVNWRATFGLGSVGVFMDPTFQLVSGGSIGTPQSTLVDPRTMRVISVEEGYSGDLTPVENLANLNDGN